MNLMTRMKRVRNQTILNIKEAGKTIKKEVKKEIEFKHKLNKIKKDSYNKERVKVAKLKGREKAHGSIINKTRHLYNKEKKENKINQIPPMFR